MNATDRKQLQQIVRLRFDTTMKAIASAATVAEQTSRKIATVYKGGLSDSIATSPKHIADRLKKAQKIIDECSDEINEVNTRRQEALLEASEAKHKLILKLRQERDAILIELITGGLSEDGRTRLANLPTSEELVNRIVAECKEIDEASLRTGLVHHSLDSHSDC